MLNPTHKTLLSVLFCLFAFKNKNWTDSFLRYNWYKNPEIWLTVDILKIKNVPYGQKFLRGFIFANLIFINILYILIFSWFAFQLVVCESRNSYSNFSIFQIALFGYKRLNSYSLISCKILLAWPSLIDREPTVKI